MLYVLLVGALAFSILARFYETFPGDVRLVLWVQTWRHPITTAFMEAASVLGVSWVTVGLAGAVASGLFAVRRWRECLAAVGVLAILSLSPLLQLLIDRPRPPADLVGITDPFGGFSFPSGHAYRSLVLFGFLIYLATTSIGNTWLRRSAQAFLVLLILAIGVSRVYLGAHWPSDVLGSYLVGSSLLTLLLQGYRTKAPISTSQQKAKRSL